MDARLPRFLDGSGGLTSNDGSLLRAGIGGGLTPIGILLICVGMFVVNGMSDGVDASVRAGIGGGRCLSIASTSSSGSYGGSGGGSWAFVGGVDVDRAGVGFDEFVRGSGGGGISKTYVFLVFPPDPPF